MKSFVKTIMAFVILTTAYSLGSAQEATQSPALGANPPRSEKAQEAPKTIEQIAKEMDIKALVPDVKIVEKLTEEEKEQLKLRVVTLISAMMAQSYKKGTEDASAFFLKQFAEFAAAQQKAAAEE